MSSTQSSPGFENIRKSQVIIIVIIIKKKATERHHVYYDYKSKRTALQKYIGFTLPNYKPKSW